eukprot:TRINITY_DN6713_c0_g1_i1.p1 TRINITY_DN6713_c0_g1~~TRINITY_DN6713_c0_g1_i1.p1  ORF type:complete len:1141 (-),score=231.14 TRINITY_DN6713_c0_g1_i1:152-3574(-)
MTLLCDINKNGQLLEFGKDPFYMPKQTRAVAIQYEENSSPEWTKTRKVERAIGAHLSNKPKDRDFVEFALHASPAAQALRLAVGLLGLEAHAAPKPWVEAWLTFEDTYGRKMGLAGPHTQAANPAAAAAEAAAARSAAAGVGAGGGEGGAVAVDVVGADAANPVLPSVSTIPTSTLAAAAVAAAPPAIDEGASISPANGGEALEIDAARAEEIRAEKRRYRNRQDNWQTRVLMHLQDVVEESSCDASVADPHGWGPNFQEQLQLAEYVLTRVTHAVGVLQSPEQDDRAHTLRQHTEAVVNEVCGDLRQWLEQLSTLFSLYHVHLLDKERARRELAEKLKVQEACLAESEQQTQKATSRAHVVTENAREERMKKEAERMLGIEVVGPDTKIYSQRDVDDMKKKWREEELEPLLAELRELRSVANEGREKFSSLKRAGMQKSSGGRGRADGAAEDGEGLSKQAAGVAASCMTGLSQRTVEDNIRLCLMRAAESFQKGGEGLEELLLDVEKLPMPKSSDAKKPGDSARAGGDDPGKANKNTATACLEAVAKEVGQLEEELRKCPASAGMSKVCTMAGWARDTLNSAVENMKKGGNNGGSLKWQAAPKWDISSLKNKSSSKAVGVGPGPGIPASADRGAPVATGKTKKGDDIDWEARMRALQAEMQAQLDEALAKAAAEKARADEAMRKMEEELAKADDAMAALRGKMQKMEGILASQGLGTQAASAIKKSGLTDFIQGRDVFQRLYRDALDRMRRLAEAQARLFKETSDDFFRAVNNMVYSPLQRLEAPYSIQRLDAMGYAAAQKHAQNQLQAAKNPPSTVGLPLPLPPGGSEVADERIGSPLQVVRLSQGDSYQEIIAPTPIQASARASTPMTEPQPSGHPLRISSALGGYNGGAENITQAGAARSIDSPERQSSARTSGGHSRLRTFRTEVFDGGGAGIDLTIAAGRLMGDINSVGTVAAASNASVRQSAGVPAIGVGREHLARRRPIDGEVLPPLECRGRQSSGIEQQRGSQSPVGVSGSSLVGSPGTDGKTRSRSPTHGRLGDPRAPRWPGGVQPPGEMGVLAVSSLAHPSGANVSKAKFSTGRIPFASDARSSSSGMLAGRLVGKQQIGGNRGGLVSMSSPNLRTGQPRLLVQTVTPS